MKSSKSENESLQELLDRGDMVAFIMHIQSKFFMRGIAVGAVATLFIIAILLMIIRG